MSPTKNEKIHFIQIEQIEVLNPRERNEKVFAEIVESIRLVGLKKPITVTQNVTGNLPYQLICGEGRIKAFKALGEIEIPARIINVNEEEALIMSLVENIARKQHRALDLLSSIERLSDLGYDKYTIAQKTGLTPDYIKGIITLLKNGEERLLYAVEQKRIPLSVAITISKTANSNLDMQIALQEAYESGELKGNQLLHAKKVIDCRQNSSKSLGYGQYQSNNKVSSNDIVRSYQKEVQRQQIAVKKSEHNQQKLAFITGALMRLRKDEHFSTLLRAESLDSLPQYINEQIL
ncbi:ParB/RepB/Spo0J family partition protein [Acinetobacter ursingii]|uniref:ParB/RepB/Spo0J family partition protein n=1 Tax=Acinetobacter ursingii TaxID=108980 RepID=A0AA46P958_9GAMM|nr:ParB/RepB/Spo0J family partition protein [Acinetobacter ursingii]MCU4603437.1 ParB/RepB/Spo0J family partition protein [Acinetobacter ursingii]MDH2019444.1 ParB/RepB/Spo0J family partition protein [Acinetobacter ursingii]MDH2071818.1 ParB/RepB/Spo0J family partition protein [Acinetobacter ursingii]UYF76518.1 ParB/RepB/Spo0J family partition protein [Acinetobacter ursingii]